MRPLSHLVLGFALLASFGCIRKPATSDSKTAMNSHYQLTTEDQIPQLMLHEGAIMKLWNQNDDKFISVNRYYGTGDTQTKINLNYKNFINPDSNKAIVISHGFGEYIGKYRELIYDFYRNGYSVYILSHRGFGRSERILKDNSGRAYTDNFDYFANDLNAFIEIAVKPRNYSRIFLFGHSMGGAIASIFLRDYPGKVNAAVLAAPMIEPLTPPPYTEAQIFALTTGAIQAGAATEYLPGQSDPNPALDILENSGTSSLVRFEEFKKWRNSEDQDEKRPFSMWGSTHGFINASIAGTIKLRQPELVKHIVTPVLIGVSLQDTFVNSDSSKKFCASLQNCGVVEYADKHELWFDKDETKNDFIGKMLDFFTKN